MTLLQVRVTQVQDAEVAIAAGADLLDVELGRGSDIYRAVSTVVPEPERVHASLAHLGDERLLAFLTEIDRVALPPAIFDLCRARQALPPGGTKAVDMLLAADSLAPDAVEQWTSAGAGGIILETADGKRLLDHMDIAALGALAAACRRHGMRLGFGGALPPPDIGRLLLLAPDFLRLRPSAALARDVRMARDLIPRAARSSAAAPEASHPVHTDRVFVRDLVVPMSIGAYRGERGRLQRVRFSVEADVERLGEPAKDMRDVFSYDLVIDRIRLIAAEGHVDLVETLAEKIAAALLDHPRIVEVRIRVEKLDVVEAQVGIEISRRRAEKLLPNGTGTP